MDDEPAVHPLAQAAIDAHAALAPKLAEAKTAHVVDLLETFERDIAPLIAPHVRTLLDNPALPPELRPLFEKIAAPEHFGESIVLGIALGSIIGPALQAIFEPVLTQLTVHQWQFALTSSSGVANPGRPIPADVAVSAVLKGVLGPLDPADQARSSGYGAKQFAQMVEVAGQSLGLAEALLLERRDQFVGITLEEVLRYSNMNPKFYKSAANLKYMPPSVGEVLTAWLKQKLPTDTAKTYIKHAGIDADQHFGWLSESTGRPLTWHEVFTAIHRGYPGPITAEQSLAESDIHPRYQAVIPYLQHNYPPLFQLMRLLHAGTITPERAATILKYEGYEQTEIDAIVASGGSTSTTVKDLTLSQVERMYTTRLIDRPTAVTKLTAAKYSPADIDLLLRFADDQRHEQLLQATITKVGTLYVAHKLSLTDATAALNTAGVPVAAQHDLFRLWDIQRTATSHVPSPSMVVAAGRRQEISPHEVKQRLNQLGIANDDLAIFVADGWPPSHALEAQAAAHAVVSNLAAWPTAAGGPPPTVRKLTVAQISQLYTAGTIGTAEATRDLETLGYSNLAATQLISTFTKPLVPKP